MVLESMDPFNWTRDKTIYQRWQLWSHKARLALDAMEGDSAKTKISYFHHWINREGISWIEGWKNNKALISQSDYDALPNKEGKYSSDKIESYFTLYTFDTLYMLAKKLEVGQPPHTCQYATSSEVYREKHRCYLMPAG